MWGVTGMACRQDRAAPTSASVGAASPMRPDPEPFLRRGRFKEPAPTQPLRRRGVSLASDRVMLFREPCEAYASPTSSTWKVDLADGLDLRPMGAEGTLEAVIKTTCLLLILQKAS